MGALKSLAVGLLSSMPGSAGLVARRPAAPDAMADYSIALKHLTLMQLARPGVPDALVELGPGASLGVGFVALLLGARRYLALDVERHVAPGTLQPDRVVALARLICQRTPLRNADGFPSLRPQLDATGFPLWLGHQLDRTPLDEARLRHVLDCASQLHASRAARAADLSIDYVVPWDRVDSATLPGSADAVMSHAVLQHVQDPAAAHRQLAGLLKVGAVATHQIAYNAHHLSASWNGHWRYGDRLWSIMLGQRRYLLNRLSHSQHVDALATAGFEVVTAHTALRHDGTPRERLAPRFRALSDADLATAGSFLVLRLRG